MWFDARITKRVGVISGLVAFCATSFLFLKWSAVSEVAAAHLFNADALYPYAFWQDVFGPLSMRGWKLPPAPYFFPDLLLYLPAYYFTTDPVDAQFLYVVIFCSCGLVLWTRYARLALPADISNRFLFVCICWLHIALLAGAMLFGKITQWIILVLPGHHAGLWLCAPAVMCLLAAPDRLRTYDWIGAGTIIALVVSSDRLALVVLIAPFLIVYAFSVFRRNLRLNRINFWCFSVAVVAGLLLDYKLRDWNFFIIPSAWSEAASDTGNIDLPARLLLAAQDGRQLYLLAAAGFLLLVLVLIRIARATPERTGGVAYNADFLKKSDYKNNRGDSESIAKIQNSGNVAGAIPTLIFFVLIGTLLSVLATTGMTVLSGHFAPRYLGPAMLLLFSTLFLASMPGLWGITGLRNNWPVLIVCMSIVLIVSAIGFGISFRSIRFQHPLAACLTKHAQRYNLHNGLADYWNARPTTLFSANGMLVNPVSADLQPLYWINNYYAFFGAQDSPAYDFIVPERLNAQLIRRRFGVPAAVIRCGPEAIEVYIYNRPEDETFRNLFRASRAEVELWRSMTGR